MVEGSAADEWSRLLDGWMLLVAKDWVGRRYLWSAWAEPEDDMPTHAGTADSLAAAKSAAERSIGEMP